MHIFSAASPAACAVSASPTPVRVQRHLLREEFAKDGTASPCKSRCSARSPAVALTDCQALPKRDSSYDTTQHVYLQRKRAPAAHHIDQGRDRLGVHMCTNCGRLHLALALAEVVDA